MGWEGWFSLGIIGLVLVTLAWGRVAADVVMVGAVATLVFVDYFTGANILTTRQAVAGMSNEGMITVAVMYVVVCGLTDTGAIGWLGRRLLGRPKTLLGAQLRLMAPTAGLSAFMNNTPLVAMFIPVVTDWCNTLRLSPSKMMIPLSYAAIMGGTLTLIGTSTNLVVSGKWVESGRPALGFFEIARVGLPCMLVGMAFLLLTSRRLLPVRKPVLDVGADPRSYTVEMTVDADGPLVGRTIEQAGLRHLPGLFLAEIERGGSLLAAVGPEEKLLGDDRLVFVGIVESIVDLRKIRGISPATNQVVKLNAPRPQRRLIEAVVSNSSPLVGKSVKEGRFRSVYNAVVIAVARNGERVNQKIGEIVLRPGDTLLLEAPRAFIEQHRNSRDFLLVSALENSAPVRHEKAMIALATLAGMIAIATIQPFGLQMIHAAVMASGVMLLTRCCSATSARRSVDWMVLVVIASALALGTALENTGAAKFLATQMIALAGGNPFLTLAMVYLVTTLLTEMITNNAAAVLVFSVALAAAEQLGADFKPFAMCIMMAASACFATPIGYQTNLMVMTPGGYRFSDYLRIGAPLNLIMWVVTVPIAAWVWPLMPV
ncbi:MAG: SLC13 family permease [Phycisphaerales bacterium]|nr:SLC13 family permease [Phycisphaerales bacterium]